MNEALMSATPDPQVALTLPPMNKPVEPSSGRGWDAKAEAKPGATMGAAETWGCTTAATAWAAVPVLPGEKPPLPSKDAAWAAVAAASRPQTDSVATLVMNFRSLMPTDRARLDI
jgi:hypothetical protein